MKKVIWVKFGWSEYYRGGEVDGDFEYLEDGTGGEAFNFYPGPDGTYYCYVPPQGGKYLPQSSEPDGWTVICLSKHPKHKGIHIVGWYEDATLHGDWLKPPADIIEKRKIDLLSSNDWYYSITSKTAYFIPPEKRESPFSEPSIKQGKYSYLKGPGVDTTDDKKRVLRLLQDKLDEIKPVAIKNPDEKKLPDPELDKTDPLKGFGTAEDRKKVEQAAERIVIAHYEAKGYEHKRVTNLPCGYDFIFTKKSNSQSELHVEVKGTSSSSPQFFLTRNEYEKGLQRDPVWRLVLVTSALDAPNITEYNAAELKKAFDLTPYVYIGKFIPKPES